MHSTAHEYTFHYSRYPALRAYVDRVRAEQVNFRRFLVKEYRDDERKYYEIKATIRIVNGEVVCNKSEFDASGEEKAAIKAELAEIEFPHSIPASVAEVDELRSSGAITGELFVFLDESYDKRSKSRDRVIMCQERREKRDGGKYYVSWTRFQAKGWGSRWLEMEPDGDTLPHWKPPKYREKAHVMIHEGAKAAKFWDDLVNDPERSEELKAHKFGEELAACEHWGAMGGALAIDRSDMNELRRLVKRVDGTTVTYICDHDNPGEKAAQLYSRAWMDSLTVVRFDQRFRPAYDLADPVPESVRDSLRSFMEPGTWATKKVGETSHGRPLYALNEAFAREWTHVNEPELYISNEFPRLMYDQKGFDHHCAGFADRGARVSELLKSYKPGHVDTINYRPDLSSGRYTTADGAKFFNIYIPRRWPPYKKAPDIGLWLDYLERVFPDSEDRRQIMRWAATFISRPEIKMEYSLLLISETHGIGKTTLADVLAEIVGPTNVAYVEEQDIIGRFNDWREKRLIICEEIYAGHSKAVYNQLKSVATNKTVRVEKKNQPRYDIDNFGHVIACSNSIRALNLDNSDRRWFVPELTEQKHGKEYWVAFHRWLTHDEGYRKIVWWADEFLKREQPVLPGEEAPWTATNTKSTSE
jgi:hypothetical protein